MTDSPPPRPRLPITTLAVLAAAACLPRPGAAQAVRVDVRDALTGRAVPQALVSARAAGADRAAAEGATSAAGRRTLGVPAGSYRIEVRRIGHRPFVGPVVTVAGHDTVAVAVRLPRAPVSLASVGVRGRSVCRTAADPAVVALWDAARTALATTADARATVAAAVPAVVYERSLDTAGAVVAETRTPVPTDSLATRVFWAVKPEVLERFGFVLGSLEEGAQFNGPDERALLSETFARTHCFAPARGGGPDRRWLGVRFTPAPDRRVPEVAGVIWLDSATAEPRRVEFDYVWSALPRSARGLGGVIEFGRLPTRELAVWSWRIRTPLVASGITGLRLTGYRETGGQLAPEPVARVRVAGTVYDSLAGAPLAGAIVTGAGAPGVALSDSAGRFALDSAEATFGELVFSHPALDSAGLADLVAAVDLSPGRAPALVALASPSRSTVWARVCEAPLPAGPRSGILAGVLRDALTGAPIAGGAATVAWTGVDTTGPRPVGVTRTFDLRADSTGAFRACGVPADAELDVRVAERGASGRALVVLGRSGLAMVDLLVARPDSASGAAAARVVATGLVRDSLGRPRAGALVSVSGVAGAEARTAADGTFRLAGVPAGTQTFVVRAAGYRPQTRSVGLRASDPEPVEITMRRVTQLARVTVRGNAGRARLLSEVASRRRLGFGAFLDSAALRNAVDLRSAFLRLPNVVVRANTAATGWALTTGGDCAMIAVVDDRVTTWDEVNDLVPTQVTAVEVYPRASSVPGRFQGLLKQAEVLDRRGCGIAVFWTGR